MADMIFPKMISYEYTVPSFYEGTVCDFLKSRYNYSSRVINAVKQDGKLLVNGEYAYFITKIREGDKICIILPKEKNALDESDLPLDIIYEDADILIINKQANVVVHPTKSHAENTIANAVAKHWRINGYSAKPRFVNRIDMDTTGIVVCAKNKYAHHVIQTDFISGKSVKKYIAITAGIPSENKGIIDVNIARTEPFSIKREVTECGDRAITHYEVLKRYKDYALISLRLMTGRTHQIRVHLSHIGCPIAGDSLYGTDTLIKRQALHAQYISFTHPRSGRKAEFSAPLPSDMLQALKMLEEECV